MATRGGSGQLFEMIRDGGQENARLGQMFVLFGLLSVVGGLGLFVLTEWYRFDESVFLTYRRAAVGFAGYGLPAFLYGLVVVMEGGKRAVEVGVAGVLLSAAAVVAFFFTYPAGWALQANPIFVGGTLGVYVLGAMLTSFAAGGAMFATLDEDDEPDEEAGFIWGEPPGN